MTSPDVTMPPARRVAARSLAGDRRRGDGCAPCDTDVVGVDGCDGVPIVGVALEPLRVDHAGEMWSTLADRELYAFTGGEPPSRVTLTERYRSQVAGSGRTDERWLNWIVRRTDRGEAIGFVQATVVGDVADIAWLIGVGHQRQGFAARAVRAMVEELESAGVDRFEAHVHRDHVRSQRVASAVGLRRTGLVDDDGEEIWANVTA